MRSSSAAYQEPSQPYRRPSIEASNGTFISNVTIKRAQDGSLFRIRPSGRSIIEEEEEKKQEETIDIPRRGSSLSLTSSSCGDHTTTTAVTGGKGSSSSSHLMFKAQKYFDDFALTPGQFALLTLDHQRQVYFAEDLRITSITRVLVTISAIGFLYLCTTSIIHFCSGIRGILYGLLQILFVFTFPCIGIPATRNRNVCLTYFFCIWNLMGLGITIFTGIGQLFICVKVNRRNLPVPPEYTPDQLVYLLVACFVVSIFSWISYTLTTLLAFRLARRIHCFNKLPTPPAPHMDESFSDDVVTGLSGLETTENSFSVFPN